MIKILIACFLWTVNVNKIESPFDRCSIHSWRLHERLDYTSGLVDKIKKDLDATLCWYNHRNPELAPLPREIK